MFLDFNEMMFVFEEDSGGNDSGNTDEQQQPENQTDVTEETEVVVEEPKKTRITKKKADKKVDTDSEELKRENQQLKVENKLQLLCNENNLDSTVVKELIPNFDNATEESITAFITKLVEVTPKLNQPKKAVPTPRIVPSEPKKDVKTERNQKMMEYFGGGGSKKVFGTIG